RESVLRAGMLLRQLQQAVQRLPLQAHQAAGEAVACVLQATRGTHERRHLLVPHTLTCQGCGHPRRRVPPFEAEGGRRKADVEGPLPPSVSRLPPALWGQAPGARLEVVTEGAGVDTA